MNSEKIRPGDLVMVVRSHCTKSVTQCGQIHIVISVDIETNITCCRCHKDYINGPIAEMMPGRWHPVAWLKRIDPIAEPERVERDTEVVA